MIRRLVVSGAVAAAGLVGIAPGVAAVRSSTDAPAPPIVGTVTRTLANTVPALVRQATDLGAISPLTSLHVALPLALPDRSSLDRFVDAQYRPGSRQFHRFLSPSAFGARFGAPQGEVALVASALHSLGLRVAAPDPNRLFVTASGPAQLLERVFGTAVDR